VAGPDFGIALGLAYQAFVDHLRSFLAGKGFGDLGRSDGYVFRALAERPMTVGALAARLGVTKQAAAQIVEDMRRRGYLRRDPDPTDRRAALLALTDRGTAALDAARQFHRRFERRLVREHGDDAVRALRAVITAMAGLTDDVPHPHIRAMYL